MYRPWGGVLHKPPSYAFISSVETWLYHNLGGTFSFMLPHISEKGFQDHHFLERAAPFGHRLLRTSEGDQNSYIVIMQKQESRSQPQHNGRWEVHCHHSRGRHLSACRLIMSCWALSGAAPYLPPEALRPKVRQHTCMPAFAVNWILRLPWE